MFMDGLGYKIPKVTALEHSIVWGFVRTCVVSWIEGIENSASTAKGPLN